MPVSSYGACQTENKDVFTVAKLVENAIRNLVLKDKRKDVIFDPNNKFAQIDISPSSGMLVFHFTLRGEKRSLYLHFDCDSDYADEIPGKKLLWSVNQWGAYEEIINAIGKALSHLGPVYALMNDCDGRKFDRLATL